MYALPRNAKRAETRFCPTRSREQQNRRDPRAQELNQAEAECSRYQHLPHSISHPQAPHKPFHHKSAFPRNAVHSFPSGFWRILCTGWIMRARQSRERNEMALMGHGIPGRSGRRRRSDESRVISPTSVGIRKSYESRSPVESWDSVTRSVLPSHSMSHPAH